MRIALVGRSRPPWSSTRRATQAAGVGSRISLKRGQILKVAWSRGRARPPAVAGGFALPPPFMGSLSTYRGAGVGGFRAGSARRAMACRSPAIRRRPAASRSLASPSTMAAGRSASSGGRRTTISARAAAAPSRSPTTASPRRPIAWAFASRARRSSTPSASTRVAPTSSPTASGPAPSRCRAPACRSCCWPTARPWAAIPRSPPWPRSTCRGWAACCRAKRCASPAVTVEEAEQLRRDQEARIQRALSGFTAARPPGGIDLVRLYEENLIDGIVYERDQASR